MKRLTVVFVFVLPLLLSVAGCNFLSFTNPTDSDRDYVAEGMEYLWDGKFAEAEEAFTNALAENPNNADARWGRAKARMRRSGFLPIRIAAELSTFKQTDGEDPLPFMDWDVVDAEKLFQALIGAKEDLHAIYSGEARNLEFADSADVELDYAAVTAVHAIISLRDTNLDMHITGSDINFNALFNTGNILVLQQWQDMPAEDRAAFLDHVSGLLIGGAEAVALIIAGLEGGSAEGLDIGGLSEVLGNVESGLDQYYPGQPPLPFRLVSPVWDDTLTTEEVPLVWESTFDPDGGVITYDLYVARDTLFEAPFVTGLTDTTCTFTGENLRRYYWRVYAVDSDSNETQSSNDRTFKIILP